MNPEYLTPPHSTSHSVACIADGPTSMSLCGRFMPSAHGFGRTERRPYKVCGQCQRADKRLHKKVLAKVSQSCQRCGRLTESTKVTICPACGKAIREELERKGVLPKSVRSEP